MTVPAGWRALLSVLAVLGAHCVYNVAAVQGLGVGRLAGSGLVPPSVCDLGLASALTGPPFLYLYNEGLDPSPLFISDKMSLKVRQFTLRLLHFLPSTPW